LCDSRLVEAHLAIVTEDDAPATRQGSRLPIEAPRKGKAVSASDGRTRRWTFAREAKDDAWATCKIAPAKHPN